MCVWYILLVLSYECMTVQIETQISASSGHDVFQFLYDYEEQITLLKIQLICRFYVEFAIFMDRKQLATYDCRTCRKVWIEVVVLDRNPRRENVILKVRSGIL